jgi:glycosyltransferase involved in cell wall biosynthesis
LETATISKRQFMNIELSIVIPLLNESESLPELEAWIRKVMEKHQFSYEIIFIDDGSTDNSWQIIQQLSSLNPAVKGIKFRRNYGKSAGLNEGFKVALGTVVFTMDADLQDSPEELPEMYRMVKEKGFDLVSGWKQKRFDSFIKNNTSKLYNWTTRKMSGIQLNGFNCGLKAYKLEVVKNIEVYGEMHRYIPVIAYHAGFVNIGEKAVTHQARPYGVTKFGAARFIRGPLDLLSIMFVSRFSKRPMHFFGLWGTLIFLLGFISALLIGVNKLYFINIGQTAPLVTETPYFYIALTCMIIGTQLFLSGFLADMISRNAPGRNKYGVTQRIGLEDTLTETDTLRKIETILQQTKSEAP